MTRADELREESVSQRRNFTDAMLDPSTDKIVTALSAIAHGVLHWGAKIAAELAELREPEVLQRRPMLVCSSCNSVLTVKGQMLGAPSCCGKLMAFSHPANHPSAPESTVNL